MRYQGRIIRWDDAKGFGQVVWHGGGDPVFVHVKAFARGSRRPMVDDIVTYELGADERGRPRAERVEFPRKPGGRQLPTGPVGKPSVFPLLLGAGLVVLLILAWLAQRMPTVVLLAYAGMSLLTFVAYGFDKAAAQAGDRRTPESTLQAMALFGGWPGALLAQRLLRHKSRKTSFQQAFWGAVAINVIAAIWLASAGGAPLRLLLSNLV